MEPRRTDNLPPEYDLSKKALFTYGRSFFGLQEVYGVGIGKKVKAGVDLNIVCVKVFVDKKLPLEKLPVSRRLPAKVNINGADVWIDIDEMDYPASPQPDIQIFPKEQRGYSVYAMPLVRPGRSGANIWFAVGTIGVCAKPIGQASDKLEYIISCNHVLANLNQVALGTPVIEPAALDGGVYPKNQIGYLANYIPFQAGYGSNNMADAAIAYLEPGINGSNATSPFGDIKVCGVQEELMLSPQVSKIGRTTGLTSGEIKAIHCMLKVDYSFFIGPGGYNTIFEDQIVSSVMAAYGDSGSLLINSKNEATGILFGGSSTHTYYSPLNYILNYFSLQL